MAAEIPLAVAQAPELVMSDTVVVGAVW